MSDRGSEGDVSEEGREKSSDGGGEDVKYVGTSDSSEMDPGDWPWTVIMQTILNVVDVCPNRGSRRGGPCNWEMRLVWIGAGRLVAELLRHFIPGWIHSVG